MTMNCLTLRMRRIHVTAFWLSTFGSWAQPSMTWQSLQVGVTAATGGPYDLRAAAGSSQAVQAGGGPYRLVSGFWSVVPGVAPGGNLILNGGFEDISGAFVADGDGRMALVPDSTLIPGWTTLDEEVAWVGNANAFGTATPFGGHFLELTGFQERPSYGGIRQVIGTQEGQRYRVSISLGSNSAYPGAGGRKQILLTCGVDATTLAFDPPGISANEWETFHFSFVATSAVTPITITGLNASGIYLAVDNVSVMREGGDLPILEIQRSGIELRIRFVAARGQRYVLETSPSLRLGSWQEVPGTATSDEGGLSQIVVPILFGEPQQFCRLRAVPAAGR